MRLKGILDFSLGNFLCLRGFAPMGVLQDISKPDDNIQRTPKTNDSKKSVTSSRKENSYSFPRSSCASTSTKRMRKMQMSPPCTPASSKGSP